MADPGLSTPVPDDEDDEALFGPGGAQDGQQPPTQPTGASASAGGPATVVGLDPQLQQMMVQMMQSQQMMMQNQQQTLQVLVAKMEADERRRREQEALSAAVSNPFGGASSAAAAGSPTAKASAPPPAPSQNLHVGSNRAEKYLPALPLIDNVSMGKGRVRELEEYHRWCEVLASWLALIDDNYVNELRQAMTHDREIKQSDMAVPVASRSARLFYYLQQSLQKFERGMELVRSTSMRQGQAACGYEVMRQMHQTFSIVSRMEAIAVRDEALRLTSKASSYKRPLDCVRFLEDELGKVDQKLHRFPELRLGASDRSTLLLQSVSPECRHYVVLHGKSGSWEELVESIRFYEEQTRLCDAGSLNAVGERGLCWNCGKSGHMSWQCPDKYRSSNAWRR